MVLAAWRLSRRWTGGPGAGSMWQLEARSSSWMQVTAVAHRSLSGTIEVGNEELVVAEGESGSATNSLIEFRAAGRKFGILKGLVRPRRSLALRAQEKLPGNAATLSKAVSARQKATKTFLELESAKRAGGTSDGAIRAAAVSSATPWALVEDLEDSALHKLHKHAITFAFMHAPQDTESARSLVGLMQDYFDAFSRLMAEPHCYALVGAAVRDHMAKMGGGGEGRAGGMPVESFMADLLREAGGRAGDGGRELLRLRESLGSEISAKTLDTYVVRRWVGEGEGRQSYETSMVPAGPGEVPQLLIHAKDVVEEVEQKAKEDSEMTKMRKRFVAMSRLVLKKGGHAPPAKWYEGEKYAACVAEVKDFALVPTGQSKTVFEEVLKPLGYDAGPGGAYKMLVDLGVWEARYSPFYYRILNTGLVKEATPQVLYQQEMMDAHAPVDQFAQSRFYVSDPVYCIDPPNADALDDGISLGETGVVPAGSTKGTPGARGRWVHIHAADVSHHIAPDTPIDRFARRQGQSFFLAEDVLAMYPGPVLRTRLSLSPDRGSYGMSFAAFIEDDTGVMVDYRVYPSMLGNLRKMNYKETDIAISDHRHPEHSNLLKLLTIAKNFQSWRESHKQAFQMGESSLPAEVYMDMYTGPMSASGESYAMVRELMILAGHVAGLYGKSHRLPLCYSARDGLHRGLSSVVGQHTALGLEAYAQVTSPIRRYPDVVNHVQIKKALQIERPAFSADQVEAILVRFNRVKTRVTDIEDGSWRFWRLLELENLKETQFAADVVKVEPWYGKSGMAMATVRLPVVEGLMATVGVKDNTSRGDRIAVELQRLDVYEGILELAVVPERSSQRPQKQRKRTRRTKSAMEADAAASSTVAGGVGGSETASGVAAGEKKKPAARGRRRK